jgi:hypothetical protein
MLLGCMKENNHVPNELQGTGKYNKSKRYTKVILFKE